MLKTVIAQDAAGSQSMSAWAIKESQMVVEPIKSADDRRDRLDRHLERPGLVAVVRRLPGSGPRGVRDRPARNLLVVPSVKYHLPAPGETAWRTEEYSSTTRAILDAYQSSGGALADAAREGLFPDAGGFRTGRRSAHRSSTGSGACPA